MKAIRALAVAGLITLDVSAAAAQSTRHFTDSWFWGVKGGVLSYQVQSSQRPPDNTVGNATSALAGVDWLITRKKGGLYVAFDHSFVRRDSVFVNDSISPLDTVARVVRLSGMRRFTFAGMLFPIESQRIHPYIGLGAALSAIVKAEPVGSFRNNTQQNLVLATVNQFKAVASPVVILGTQVRLLWVSAFIQGTATPTYNNFFLFTTSGWRTSLEAGARYNIGSSIDRMR